MKQSGQIAKLIVGLLLAFSILLLYSITSSPRLNVNEFPSMAGQKLLLLFGLPLLPMSLIYFSSIKGLGQSGALSFGKNRAKIHDRSAHIDVSCEDVAGVDEVKAELIEIVDFLKTLEKYQRVGGRIPRGVLLVGPPGTGKMLLAEGGCRGSWCRFLFNFWMRVCRDVCRSGGRESAGSVRAGQSESSLHRLYRRIGGCGEISENR